MGSSVVVNTDVARALLKNGKVMDLIIYEASLATFDQVEKNISQENGSGKAYKKNGRVHVASAPGAYPTKDTGFLASSIYIEQPRSLVFFDRKSKIHFPEQPSLELEFGTSRIQSRPFIIRSLNQVLSSDLDKIIGKVISYLETKPRIYDFLKLGGAPVFTASGKPANKSARRLRRTGSIP